MKTIFVKPETLERKWFVIDAKGKVLGRVAEKAACIVRGKTRPYYTPHQDIGDFVIIVNADQMVVSGKKLSDKLYYNHSGYPGGMKVENLGKLFARKPIKPLETAIRGMLPGGALGNKLFRNVKIYAGTEHPHAAQKPEAIEMA
jgi:large subunit ribosomal protein L13